MKIRQATRAEIGAVSELATKSYIQTFKNRFTAEELEKRIKATRSIEFYNRAFNKDIILLAEEDGKLIGYVQFGEPTFDVIETSDEDKELQRAYVLEDYQGKGIGTALIKSAFEHPILKNAKNIYLDVWDKNYKAQKLYKSLGFEFVAKWDEDIIMRKRNIHQSG